MMFKKIMRMHELEKGINELRNELKKDYEWHDRIVKGYSTADIKFVCMRINNREKKLRQYINEYNSMSKRGYKGLYA